MKEERIAQLEQGNYFDNDPQKARYITILKAEPEKSNQNAAKGYSWDEIGMSDLFSECYKDTIHYCPEFRCWLTYSNGAWRRDTDNLRSNDYTEEFCKLMRLYCVEIENKDRQDAYYKFLSKMGDIRFLERMLRAARSKMTISANTFDTKPYLVNCLNGTYDLETGIFREHDPADLLTMQTNFEYAVKPTPYPRWEQFIEEVTQSDRDKARYLQKALGYSIYGEAQEECMFFLHGKTTRNGKSTMLNAVHHLMGDYAAVAPVALICKNGTKKDANAPSPALVALKGKRFVTMAESDRQGKLDEETLKSITGREQISVRGLYMSDQISYLPQFTLWLSCNDLPAVRDESVFASDRARVIEFNRHFSEREQEHNLKDEFRSPEAMQGIFYWLTEGYRLYKAEGLKMPDAMRTVVKQYEKDNDLILQFLEDRCERAADAVTRKKALYDSYKIWIKSNGYQYFLSAQKFNKALEAHSDWYDDCTRKPGGFAVYDGLKLKP